MTIASRVEIVCCANTMKHMLYNEQATNQCSSQGERRTGITPWWLSRRRKVDMSIVFRSVCASVHVRRASEGRMFFKAHSRYSFCAHNGERSDCKEKIRECVDGTLIDCTYRQWPVVLIQNSVRILLDEGHRLGEWKRKIQSSLLKRTLNTSWMIRE